MNPLSGADRESLQNAIVGAFTRAELKELVTHRLDLNYEGVAPGSADLNAVVFELIDRCERHGTTKELVTAVLAERPNLKDSPHLKSCLGSTAPEEIALPVMPRVLQLPARTRLIGRDKELDQITNWLRSDGGSVGRSVMLCGMGGVGKTHTAIEACLRVADLFPDGQLFVELRGMSEQPLTAVQAMSQLIRDFHPKADKFPEEEKDFQAYYRQVLEDKKALVLLDNVKDESQVRPLLDVQSVVFVVTSRNAIALDGESIRLDMLPLGEACALLRSVVGTKGSDDEVKDVAMLCGQLPLALRVAGYFLRFHANWSLRKYIAALQNESKRLEKLGRKIGSRDVEAVLGLSASELVRERPQLAERWQVLSVFPADFDAPAAAAVWDLKTGDEADVDTAENELTDLLDRSLVQFDTATDRYLLHDLMRPIARNAFEFVDEHPSQAGTADRLATAEERFAGFYCHVLGRADELYLQGNDNILRGLALFDREETNIRHGQGWSVRHRAKSRVAAELCRDYPNAGVYVIDLRFFARDRITWLEESITACREIGDRRGEGNAVGNLGLAWAALGDARKALGFHEQALAVLREIGDRRGEGGALGNMGNAWKNLGDARKAIGFHEQRLAVAREIGDRRGEGNALGSLGNAWADLGDARKAIGFHDQYLAVAREIGDRRGEGNAVGNLGLAWAALGDARKALGFHEQALAVYREIGDRRGEGGALGHIGNAWKNLGDARKAIGFYDQYLAVAREIGDRRGEGAAVGNLGNAWAALGDARTAIGLYDLRLAIAREIGDRRGEANSSYNMALALHGLGQRDEAIRFAEYALTIYTTIESPMAETVRDALGEWRGDGAT